MEQIVQVTGAVLILIAFTASQMDRMSPHSLVYLLLNLIGSLVLAVLALLDADWGFLLLEGVWALVTAWSLVQFARGRPPSAAH